MKSRLVFSFSVLSFSLLIVVLPLSAQQLPTTPDNDFVHKQFGNSCSLEPRWPPVTADLNGDGIEDIVMVAGCKNPLIDQDEKDYRVIDPYDAFYGYGNPKITSGFAPDDPKLRGVSLLVVHGAGSDGWRSASPKAKFVIINLAVKTITVKKMKVSRKKSTMAIYVEEAGADQMTSAIFWDGKKYRYEPLGSSME
jgi:hypothetical protein